MATVSASETPTSGGPRGMKMAAWLLSLALATTPLWFVLRDSRSGGSNPFSSSSREPAQSAEHPTTAGLTTLRDTRAGYELRYPDAWTEVRGTVMSAGAGGHVLRIGGRNAFSVHEFPLERPVTVSDLADMRAVTDAILSTPEAKLTVLDVRQVEVADRPTMYYLYYFPAGKQRGIHAHYFIFDGARMQTLVFQVVPASHFADYAYDFDQVVASFKTITP